MTDIDPIKARLAEMEEERDERLYTEARVAAGFTNGTDYDTWLVLEELRKLTLAERKAAEDKLNPPKLSGGIVINGAGFSNHTVFNGHRSFDLNA